MRWKSILLDPNEGETPSGSTSLPSASKPAEPASGEKTAAHPWEAITPFLDEKGNLEITVDGETRSLGPAEVQAELQKGLAGSARLEEAAKAQENVRYAEDVSSALERDDVDAYFRVAAARGWNEEEAQTLLEHFEPNEVAEDPAPEEEAAPVKYVERTPTPEEKQTAAWARAEQLKQVRHAIHSDVDAGLDKDPRFAKIIKSGGTRADELRTMAQNVVKRIVVSEGVEYTDSVRGRALDEIGHALTVFSGNAGQISQQALGASGDPLIPGTGPAPFSGAPEFAIESPTAPNRPASGTPEYEAWVIKQFQAAHEEALQAG